MRPEVNLYSATNNRKSDLKKKKTNTQIVPGTQDWCECINYEENNRWCDHRAVEQQPGRFLKNSSNVINL